MTPQTIFQDHGPFFTVTQESLKKLSHIELSKLLLETSYLMEKIDMQIKKVEAENIQLICQNQRTKQKLKNNHQIVFQHEAQLSQINKLLIFCAKNKSKCEASEIAKLFGQTKKHEGNMPSDCQ